jgi:hypothetical protein
VSGGRDGRPELATVIALPAAGDEVAAARPDRPGQDTGDVHERQALITVLDPHVSTRGEAGRIVPTALGMVAPRVARRSTP